MLVCSDRGVTLPISDLCQVEEAGVMATLSIAENSRRK